MKHSNFEMQLDRLRERFGKQTYTAEFVKILWREVSNLADSDFICMVDRFIGDSRQAPIMPDFRDALSFIREKQSLREKKEFSQTTKSAFENITLVDFIKRTIDNGKTHDLDGLVKLFGIEWVEKRYEMAISIDNQTA